VHGTLSPPARRILVTTDAVGGVWRYSLTLASGLASGGWNCTLASMGPSPSRNQYEEAKTIPGCRLIDTGLPLDWTAAREAELEAAATSLNHLALTEKAETIHLHTPSLAAFDFDVPAVAVAHSCVGTWWQAVHGTTPPQDFAWRMALMSRGMARSSAIIAPSQAFARALKTVYAAAGTIRIVHNGGTPTNTAAAHRTGAILTAGRLYDAGKNIAVLDRAAALLGTRFDAAGPCRSPDGASTATTHLNLLGTLSRQQLHAAISSAAAFAAPSLYEPFGLAVLEAAQCATPLVLADNPTFRELWDGAALFVDPRDPQAWATTLHDLQQNASQRTDLGARARSRAQSYTAASMVHHTLAIHRALLLEPA
jgi:glycogen(starch) synthase